MDSGFFDEGELVEYGWFPKKYLEELLWSMVSEEGESSASFKVK